jgi:nitrogen fixation NifU-like protein
MNEEIYKENILDHYKNPRNKRELKTKIKFRETNTICGDETTIYLKIKNKIIQEATFTGRGCAISQASISMLTERLKGITLKQAKSLTEKEILNMLGIPIGHTRIKCALLPLKALQGAIKNA